MASPDHQIPVSADLEANVEKQAESRNEFDNSTSNQQTKEGQATEVVFDLSCAPSTKDTFQSQAHVPQTEKAPESTEKIVQVSTRSTPLSDINCQTLPFTVPPKHTSQPQAHAQVTMCKQKTF